MTEKVLWELPADHMSKTGAQFEFKGLDLKPGNNPVMIEIEAVCDRFAIAHMSWSAGEGYKPGQGMEFMAGYPSEGPPILRVTFTTGGQPISALRFHFPGAVDLRQVRVRELRVQPVPAK
jgi:hypothetical protein